MEFRAASGAVWVLRVLVTTILFLVAVLLWLPLLVWQRWPAAIAAFPLATMFLGWWYADRFRRSLHGRLATNAVYVRYGVLWQREIFVPMESLRTFEVWTPPLHRLCRCRTVVLRFAGGAALLPLLSIDTAERLAARLELPKEGHDGTTAAF